MVANCHSLHNQVKQRTNNLQSSSQTIPCNNNKNINPRRHLSIPVAFLSIRGGNNEELEETDTNNSEVEDDNFSAEFVSSFESELMEIRQEAELEAEAELEKLRVMMGETKPRVVVDEEEDSDQGSISEVEDDDEDDSSNTVEEDNIRDDEQNDRDEESTVVAEEETNDISDVAESAVEDEEIKGASNDEEQISHASNDVDQLDDKKEDAEKSDIGEGVQSEDDVVVVTDDSSADEETVSAVKDTDSKKQGKPKRSKAKKSKSSKPKSKSIKSNTKLIDDIDSLSGEGLGTVESVLLTRTVEMEVESRPRGIIGFLKSDLARALSLLVATIIVSVMMQRVQRQMEAQGL